MLSVLYRRHGEPAQVLETVPVANPPAPGPGEVLVRVLSRPVHYGDLLGIAGRYRSGGDLSVPEGGNRVGFEGYGIVGAVGEGVTLEPGTRVAFFPGRAAWSEYTLVPATYVTPLPDAVSDDAAAQLHVNPLTAALLWRAVQRAGAIAGRDVVVLTAAGSAVARLTIALLRKNGVDAIGIVRSSAGAETLSRLAPDMPVVATDRPEWRDTLSRATGGKPIRAVLDPVGGTLASELAGTIANGGSLVSYGDLSGDPISVPALTFSTRDLHIFGVTVGSWGSLPADQRAEDIALALDLAASAPELFPVAAKYELSQAREAAAHVEQPGKAGVILLTSY